MSTDDRSKGNSRKGRQWIISKKKMKVPQDNMLETILDLKKLLEHKEMHLKPHANMKKSSKLTPSLFDVLKKATLLGYFLEFLKLENKNKCLDFWLEAETFYMSSKFNSPKESKIGNLSTQSSPTFGSYRKFSKCLQRDSDISLSSSCLQLNSSYLGYSSETPDAVSMLRGELPETDGKGSFAPSSTNFNNDLDGQCTILFPLNFNSNLNKEADISSHTACNSNYHEQADGLSPKASNYTCDNQIDEISKMLNISCSKTKEDVKAIYIPKTEISVSTALPLKTLNSSPDRSENLSSNFSCSNIPHVLSSCDSKKSVHAIGTTLKADQINVMHPSNHTLDEVQVHSNTYSSINTTEDVKDSNQILLKERSTSFSSFEEQLYRRTGSSFHGDALTIYQKYICEYADHPIELPLEAKLEIEASICKESTLHCEVFVRAQEIIIDQLKSLHSEFLDTDNMKTYQIKLLEDKQIHFQDVLYHKELLSYFMEYLDQKNLITCLEFYMAAVNFVEDIEMKLLNGEYNLQSAVGDAMYIYERYFSMKCEQRLIDDDKLRIVMENNICRSDGPQVNCFCIPLAYAWTVLSDIYTPSFLESDIFEAYIKHLRKTLSSSNDCSSCAANCSSDTPIEQATVEQSDTKLDMLGNENLEDFWFKSHTDGASRLSLGHVNEYGVFNSEMEPEPTPGRDGYSSLAKLGRAMRNFLRRETQEETEQLAWQRARKIIADIQTQKRNNKIN